MSEQQDPTGESLEDRDRQLFDLLEEYVNSLHRDDVPTRSGLFKRHPELAELLECLEHLKLVGPATVHERQGALVGHAAGYQDRYRASRVSLEQESIRFGDAIRWLGQLT